MVARSPRRASLVRSITLQATLSAALQLVEFHAPDRRRHGTEVPPEIFLSLVDVVAGRSVAAHKNAGIIHNRVSESWQTMSRVRRRHHGATSMRAWLYANLAGRTWLRVHALSQPRCPTLSPR